MDEVDFDVWYMNDELGSRIRHHQNPTFNMATFFYEPLGGAFSLLWPLKSCKYGEEVTRDYLNNVVDDTKRSALMKAFGAPENIDAPKITKMKDFRNPFEKLDLFP